MGVELPEDVRESYRTHNGTYRRLSVLKLFGNSYLLPLDSVVYHRRTMIEIGEDTRAFLSPVPTSGPVTSDYWSAGWVPLTTDDECAKLCIDLTPAPRGQSGQVVEWTRDEGNRVMASSWGAWLEALVDGLEAGAYWLCVPYDTTAYVWGVLEPDGWESDA
jgi:cell wall assembly regulator SMI1